MFPGLRPPLGLGPLVVFGPTPSLPQSSWISQCCAHLQCAAWSEGVCRGEGQSLLYRCDKSYHTLCLKPPLDHTPSTGWSCKNLPPLWCEVIRQWANHPFLCESCDPALPCPLCDLNTHRTIGPSIVQAGEGRAGLKITSAPLQASGRATQSYPAPLSVPHRHLPTAFQSHHHFQVTQRLHPSVPPLIVKSSLHARSHHRVLTRPCAHNKV
ncbi:hypothetical protein F7725_029231 [Dissostichus mawsoni]|uniref:Uncharacterized protein n=1 Tax=Dissostichus mawsoni TaxID=36200 RepID=A0A7J5XIK0_DISMA|nr:hypothetical protein F7725_029231 [Dissostichus mawsoni]